MFILPALAEPTPILLKLAHGAPDGHQTNLAAVELQKEIKASTNNRIQLEIFSNMQFGEEGELVELLQNGRLDLAVVSTGPLAQYNPDVAILDLPYLFNNREQAYQAWDGEPGKAILKGFKSSGIEGISFWENGLRSLTTKDRLVTVPSDLKNLKIRTMENPIYLKFFNYLGALPTPLPWGQVIPSLKEGIVESQENPVPIILYNQLEHYQKYLILTRHVYNPQIVFCGPSFIKKLKHDDAVLIKTLVEKIRIKQRKLALEIETNGLKQLQAKGMIVVEPNLVEFGKTGRKFSKEALNDFSPNIKHYFERFLQQ